jgi:regulator of cell morphogenesis and NO signaling
VGALAARSLAAVRVLESHGLDYCCQGRASLEAACRALNLDPAALLREIEEAEAARPEPGVDWTTAPVRDLVQHIINTHHAYLRHELPALEARLHKVVQAHRERHGGMLLELARTFLGLKAELEAHLAKEEEVLFPVAISYEESLARGESLEPVMFGTVQNPIRCMETEHEHAGAALARIRQLTNGFTPPPDACVTFRSLYAGLAELERDLHLHIHLENNILFPRTIQLEGI